jgi:hypothetical protein
LAGRRASDKEQRLGRLRTDVASKFVTRRRAFACDGFERTQW